MRKHRLIGITLLKIICLMSKLRLQTSFSNPKFSIFFHMFPFPVILDNMNLEKKKIYIQVCCKTFSQGRL